MTLALAHVLPFVPVLALPFLAAACGRDETPRPALSPHDDARFAVGQIWRLAGKHEDARVVVLRVERAPNEAVIVHVAVERDDPTMRIAHMPFDRDAVDRSVTELIGKIEPRYEDGYELWRDAFDRGKGGVFTISIEEAIDLMAQTLEEKRPPG
jgi:hypothetical protein